MIREVDLLEYNKLIQVQINNGVDYSEQYKGSRKTLIVRNKPLVSLLLSGSYLDLGNLTDKQFGSFLGLFKNHIYKQVSKKNLYHLKIDYNGLSRGKNKQAFDKAEIMNTWYNVDLNSAYWQMGYVLGYVSKNFYEKYIDNDEYKSAKRFCYSFLARQNFREYSNGNRIYCDNSLDQQIFDNIRNKLYCIIERALDICQDDYLEYNIDSITVSNSKLPAVIQFFDDLQLKFSVNEFVKLSENKFILKGRVRNF